MRAIEIIRKLKRAGWKVIDQKGSHVKLAKGSQRTTVPNHGTKDLGLGLVKAIEKQTGEKLL
jgi:predicted RNA binding protein YcfA (HicA-like mRNA interferase family)